jgi:glycosyltransferase involved in cell wall biosynthesis
MKAWHRSNGAVDIRNIGFVSTRFQGTDGVSLETEKWCEVLRRMGYECFFFAGACDRDPARTMILPEAHFDDPVIKKIQENCFKVYRRSPATTGVIHAVRRHIKKAIYRFVKRFHIDLIVAENCLAIPMNIPLGLALTEFIAETGMPTIAHHHDFYWERSRFSVNAAGDLLGMAFPPTLRSIQHVVINSQSDRELSYRTGLSPSVIPNVLNFKKKPPALDSFNVDVREALGLRGSDVFVLQPTRIVARKGIEHTIELVSRMEDPRVKLVITHSASDEGNAYERRIMDYAEHLGVPLVIRPEIIGDRRGRGPDGRKIYTLWDVYPHADLVTYPSLHEGFGNAFIEAVYFKKPILVNQYSSFVLDIKPLGFEVIEMAGWVTDELVQRVKALVDGDGTRSCSEMAEKNYALAARFFSYEVLERKLKSILVDFEGIVESSRYPSD